MTEPQPLADALGQIQADLDLLRADLERRGGGLQTAPNPGLPEYLRARGQYALADAVQRTKDGLASASSGHEDFR